jgi:hypothetical protein
MDDPFVALVSIRRGKCCMDGSLGFIDSEIDGKTGRVILAANITLLMVSQLLHEGGSTNSGFQER